MHRNIPETKKHKRIIFVGPTCSGKTFLRNKFQDIGHVADVAYTTRPVRPGEVDGIDYKYISVEAFEEAINRNAFFEYVKYNNHYYGTGLYEWDNSDVFVMETDAIKHLSQDDRANSMIFYINTPISIRIKRMQERGWTDEMINQRIKTDEEKFNYFTDYDVMLSSIEN